MLKYDGLGAIGYEWYGKKTGWKNHLGKPMPKWEDLPQEIRDAWASAAEGISAAIARAVLA